MAPLACANLRRSSAARQPGMTFGYFSKIE